MPETYETFKPGERVRIGDYHATVIHAPYPPMVEVRLDNGSTGFCDLKDLKREKRGLVNNDEPRAAINRARALAKTWDETPDYTATSYDVGRVDQRHDMTTQLLEALNGDKQ